MIEEGTRADLQVFFRPSLKQFYETTFVLKTNIGERLIVVMGEGAMYEIRRDALPLELDLGIMSLAEVKNINVSNQWSRRFLYLD